MRCIYRVRRYIYKQTSIAAIRLERVLGGVQANGSPRDLLPERRPRRTTVRAQDHGSTDDTLFPGQLASGMDRFPVLRTAQRYRLRTRLRSQQSGHLSGNGIQSSFV